MSEDFEMGRQYERREAYAFVRLLILLSNDRELRHTLTVWMHELKEGLKNANIEETEVYHEVQS